MQGGKDFGGGDEGGADGGSSSSGGGGKKPHVFAQLHYLRKLCNHPALAVGNEAEGHPLRAEAAAAAAAAGVPLRSATLSPKLLALQQILHECGIGAGAKPNPEAAAEAAAAAAAAAEVEADDRQLTIAKLPTTTATTT